MKEMDYKNYEFLYHQEDLEVVLDNEDFTVFKNRCDVAKIYGVDTINHAQSLDEFLEVSKNHDISKSLYVLSDKTELQESSERRALNYTKKSPVHYEIEKPTKKYVVFITSQGISAEY
jgi:pyridoxine 5'-phosphate synthase PdxJ